MMYRALYDFRSDDPRILNIKAGDKFTVLDSSRDTWWQVQNGLGVIGFVPVNYISKDETANYNDIVKSIDRSIQAIHTAATSNNGIYSKQQRDNLQKLIQHRKAVTSDPKAAASILSAATSTSSKSRQTSTDSEDVATSDPIHSGGGDDSSPGGNYLVAGSVVRTLHRSTSGDCCGGGGGGGGLAGGRHHHHHHHHHHRHRSKHRSSSHSSTHSSPSRSHKLCSREVSVDAGFNYNRSKHRSSSHSSTHSSPSRSHKLCSREVSVDTAANHHSDQNLPPVTNTIQVQCSPVRTTAAATNTTAPFFEERGSSPGIEEKNKAATNAINGNPASKGVVPPTTDCLPAVATPSADAPVHPRIGATPEHLATDLIEAVRVATSLSYENSKTAIRTVLLLLGDAFPEMTAVSNDVIARISNVKKIGDNLELSHDAVRLQVIFSEMAACKDDLQQRSWHLHEDEAVILEYLEELASILENANPLICRQAVAADNYTPVVTLVLYYQMEPRLTIRLKLLKVFAGLCALDTKIISQLLQSVLPVELARDMQAHVRSAQSPSGQSEEVDETQRLTYSALVLTMLLSTGEPLPVHHYDILNADFLTFLLNLVEVSDDDDGDQNDQIIDMAVNVILAFNLHLNDVYANPLMQVLAENSANIKVLTERIALLFNRGEDPVQMFDHDASTQPCAAQHSVIKILSDIYSTPATASLFYTNDSKVLLDIILREISDLSSSDSLRTEFLSLLHLLLTNSSYGEHLHRRGEFAVVLSAIAAADDDDDIVDVDPSASAKPGRATSVWEEQKFVVDAILRDFGGWFGEEEDGRAVVAEEEGGRKRVEERTREKGEESPPIPNFIQGRIETGV